MKSEDIFNYLPDSIVTELPFAELLAVKSNNGATRVFSAIISSKSTVELENKFKISKYVHTSKINTGY